MKSDLFGILNLNKPVGLSSRDAINHVQRLARPVKVGHAGTLDPLARGVLATCLGPATRLVPYIQRMPKEYIATYLLGRQSDTEDVEGHVSEVSDAPRPPRDRVDCVVHRFIGRIQQTPPAFSALKVRGKRSYQLARSGQKVALQPRPVHIERLEVLSYEYPQLRLKIKCGGGTYVRSLGRDIAKQLGTEAVMSALTRTAVGQFRIAESVDLTQLAAESIRQYVLPARRAVDHLSRIELSDFQIQDVAHGRPISFGAGGKNKEFAGVDQNGNLIAILVPRGSQKLGPIRNFHSAEKRISGNR